MVLYMLCVRTPYFCFIFCMMITRSWLCSGLPQYARAGQLTIRKRFPTRMSHFGSTIGSSCGYTDSTKTKKPDVATLIEESVYLQIKPLVLPNARFLLCVSGGSDSMAMLHIMNQLKSKEDLNLSLEVVNFNHKARAESDEEAEFVKEWSTKYDMPCHLREAPVGLRQNAGFQERARDWRRAECLAILDQQPAGTPPRPGRNNSYICTAHNHEDQLETLMMKFLRGTGIANFEGMKVVDAPFMKPVLHLPKAQLVQYLQQRGLDWREDSSNQQRVYQRNKVRLDLMPLLADLAGGQDGLSDRLTDLSRQSADLRAWIDAECETWSKKIGFTTLTEGVDQQIMRMQAPLHFNAVPKPVLGELLHLWVLQHAATVLSTQRTEELVALAREPLRSGKGSKTVTVCGRYSVVRVKEELRLRLREPHNGGDKRAARKAAPS